MGAGASAEDKEEDKGKAISGCGEDPEQDDKKADERDEAEGDSKDDPEDDVADGAADKAGDVEAEHVESDVDPQAVNSEERSHARFPSRGRLTAMRKPAVVSVALALASCAAPEDKPWTDERASTPTANIEPSGESGECNSPEPWEGVVRDVELDEPDSWQLVGGVFDGASRVAFADDAVCAHQALLSQTIEMPVRCVVGGAAVEVSYAADGGLSSMSYQGALVHLGDRVLDVGAEETPARLCLGERSFGRALDVAFAPSTLDACSTEAALGLSVDRLSILQDESCPAPGALRGLDAWSTYGDDSGIARVEGTAIHLGTRGCSATVYAEGPASGAVSVPDQKGLALRMRLRGTLDGVAGNGLRPLLLRVNEMFAADLPLGDDVRVCLPDAVRGTVARLKMRLTSTACEDQDVFVDEMEVIEDRACGDGLVFDGGFDVAFARGFEASLNWRRIGDVSVEPDAAGNPAAVLRRSGALRTIITVPAESAEGGPALRARVTAPAETRSPAIAGSVLIQLPQLPATWVEGSGDLLLCLPATHAGEALDVDVGLTGGAEARLDDITVGNDARCASAPVITPLGGKG